MADYDPQKNRRRPSAAETGAAPVDGLLGGVEPGAAAAGSLSSGAPPLPAPAVTPPPPLPDPDARILTVTVAAWVTLVLAGAVLVRRWWRRR